MAKRKIEEYTFADAYVGCSVKNLMTRQDLMRVAACKDLPSAEAVLREFGYGESKELYESDVESFMRREHNKVYDLIYKTLPDREELALYLFPHDYHNVKVCLKAEFLGITPSDTYLISTGDIDWMKVVAMVRDRNYLFMPVHMKEAVIEAIDLFGRGGDPQEIDIILDKACYKDMLDAAEETKEEFLIRMIKLQIDSANLKAFLRLRKMEKPWSFFQKIFLQGGQIPQRVFINSYEEPYEQAADKLQPYGFKEAMAEGGRVLKETGDFNVFEKMCDDVIMAYNKTAKYLSFGIAPIAAIWYAEETEINNLRIILNGILIGASPEQMGERLREPYV